MRLSKNFVLSEFTKSQTATRRGIDNTPSLTTIDNLQALVDNVLQPIRDHYGKSVDVSSGYRSPELNVAIGGSPTSDHCKGQAADIEIVGVDNKVLAQYIRDNLPFTQLILEFYTPGIADSGWVHVSYDKANLKKQVLTASKNSAGRTVYTPGI
jgi:zinc D-Ala-D-Ala carboxypeptidase